MSELYDIFREHPHISTDTRNIGADSIFFALRGATFDGNHFAAEALDKGAAYAVVDDPAAVTDERMVLVGDTLGALQELAREHRRRLAIPILAISGSNGKTTTKELVSRVLAERFEVYATRGNLNNHIGVPLTLLAMTRDTQFGVVEMGASACGEPPPVRRSLRGAPGRCWSGCRSWARRSRPAGRSRRRRWLPFRPRRTCLLYTSDAADE